MRIPFQLLCMSLASMLSVHAHGYATPKKFVNYTTSIGTRPMNIEKFVKSFNSDLVICNDQVYRSTIFYCYTRKSKIKLKKCRIICGGSTSTEIAHCQQRCPMFSTCNWGQKDGNQTYCEKYYDYPKPIIITSTTPIPPTMGDAKTTPGSDLTSTASTSTKNSASDTCQCHCPDYPATQTIPYPTYQYINYQATQVVLDQFIVWLLIATVFVLLILVIALLVLVGYLVVRQCQYDRRNRTLGTVDVTRSDATQSSYTLVSQDADDTQEEIDLDPQNGAVSFRPERNASVDNPDGLNRTEVQFVNETTKPESLAGSFKNEALVELTEESEHDHDEETVATPDADRDSNVSDVFDERPGNTASARERRSSFARAVRQRRTSPISKTFPPDVTHDTSRTVRRRRLSEPLIAFSSPPRGFKPRHHSSGSYKDSETVPLRGGEDTDSG